MKDSRLFKWTLHALCLGCMALSASAFANKDMLYPSAATATVNGSSVSISSNFATGANGASTLDNAIHAGDVVSLTATWSIQDRSAQPGQDTAYPKTVDFVSTTTVKPAGAPDVSVGALSSCPVTSSGSSCTTVISLGFSTPPTVGNYQVKVTPEAGGSTGLAVNHLVVNFSVAAAITQVDTKLTVAKQCVFLNQGNVPLTAKLQELLSGNAIPGESIDFFVEPELDQNGVPTVPSIGSGTTDGSGVATLGFDVNGLPVGDYTLYAQFAGDSSYKPSNDSDILGVSYVFAGFRQPINADGTSIFGGRVIPIKIKLLDANGVPVTDAHPTVWLTSYSISGVGSDLEQVSSVSAADTGNVMRYTADEQQYIYNWDATKLANGTYAVVVDLGDSDACRQGHPYAIITVAKKGKQ